MHSKYEFDINISLGTPTKRRLKLPIPTLTKKIEQRYRTFYEVDLIDTPADDYLEKGENRRMSSPEAFKFMMNSAGLTLVILFLFITAFLILWSLKCPARSLKD